MVLGMHRSGTSCLAGVLAASGVSFGDTIRGNRHNRRGYFEQRGIVEMNEAALVSAGGSWGNPPVKTEVHPAWRLEIRKKGQSLMEAGVRGVKDPRILLLLDDWMAALDEPIAILATFRHPLAVAASLARRNSMPLDASLKLWSAYNSRLIEAHQKFCFPLIAFDLRYPHLYLNAISTASRDWGLDLPVRSARAFVSSQLDHHIGESKTPIPACCADTFDYLNSKALNPVSLR